MWKEGELIRNKETKDPYIITDVRVGYIIVFDLRNKGTVVPVGIIREIDYGKFARDLEFIEIKGELLSGELELEHKKLPKIK